MHGGIPAVRRREIVDRFQPGEDECLILSVRAHRIGRRETVYVHHLIAENTVEDHIGELLRHKRAIADQPAHRRRDVADRIALPFGGFDR